MNTFVKISSILLLFLVEDCANFEKVSLRDQPDSVEGVASSDIPSIGLSALTYNQGNLLRGYTWVGNNSNVTPSKVLNEVKVKMNITGKQNTLSIQTDGLDFRGDLAILVKAKVVSQQDLKVDLELIDDQGFVTNTKVPTLTLKAGEDHRNFYFDLRGIYSQSLPDIQDVNASMIKQVRLVVSSDGKPFDGEMIIKDMRVILANDIVASKKKLPSPIAAGIIDDFEGDLKWSADKGWEISKIFDGSGVLKASFDNIGPRFQAIRRSFPAVDLSKHRIKVKARLEGTMPVSLRVDLVDFNELKTNKRPVLIEMTPSESYQEYVFDFGGRFNQSYPNQVEVDAFRISEMLIYLNPGDKPCSGVLYIDEITAIP